MLSSRPRRNRKSAAIRALVEECRLQKSDLVYPLFLTEQSSSEIKSLPAVWRLHIDDLLREIEKAASLGILSVALFPIFPEELKDESGSAALDPDNFHHKAIKMIKERFPHICLITDIALDPYTTHGHDGIFKDNAVMNDDTVDILAHMALLQAAAGSDIVAPSDMMDGRVGAIRRALEQNGFETTSILSYTAKYASAFYGPFRDALSSGPKGDKKSYQMNPANRREALLEGELDQNEGADILMVKPAIHYLDVIVKLREATTLPIAAYHTSGEFAQLIAAAQNGWIEREKALLEATLSIKRAGADMIFSYAAVELATSDALC
ncbi:MAG: Delta-aminolevulinic acid dehydratase [Chlamydiales bacterium]|nr:Delta-aminolevulinic acid dehydratase [Chlamydiales bacterium]MCH9634858.1 Delta-aminolevulinic acid dehydratase [Chlamydiales bacterium]MCH9703695.1 porphobilinogen synthase [Chlamydiota bacterium]